MGLFKKLAEKTAAGVPDHPREIAKQLSAGESVVGWAHAHPVAFVTDKHARRNGAIGMAINIASQKFSEHQHLAGADGSAAMSLPRDLNGQVTVAITDQRLTFWSFGATMREVPPTLLASFPRRRRAVDLEDRWLEPVRLVRAVQLRRRVVHRLLGHGSRDVRVVLRCRVRHRSLNATTARPVVAPSS